VINKEIAMSQRALISLLPLIYLAGFALPAAAATDARLSDSYGQAAAAVRGESRPD
jgi:hypothetical protein